MGHKKVKWTDLAIQDLILIRDYIAKDSIKNADIVFQEIFTKVDDLNLYSRKGRQIPKIDEDYYREVFIASYRIMYKIEEKFVYILGVFHMHKNFEVKDLLERN